MSSRHSEKLPESNKILIIGGYGKVGRWIAERLAPEFAGRVIIAGRSLDKAKAVAAEIGHGAQGRAADILAADSRDALEDVALVLVCLDQNDTRFVEQCLSKGIHYVDISAKHAFLSQVEALDDLARRNGATALLSVGTAPGLTNLLAARARELVQCLERIDILLEIGLGDHHGQAALEWMFDNLDATYSVREAGRQRQVRSFGDSMLLSLPGGGRKQPAYRFNFSDQLVIARTLAVPSVSTWIRFDSRFATWLFAALSRAGLGRVLRFPRWRKLALWLFMKIHVGSDICAVAVRALGRVGGSTLQETTIGVIGRKEALMTAIIAAETTRQLLTAGPGGGVFHSEQFVALDRVIAALEKEYPDLAVSLDLGV